MLPKDNKIPLNSQINENDSLNPDLNNENHNYIFNLNNYKNPNQLNILENNNFPLNNNFPTSPLLINNISYEKELYNLNNQSRPTISNEKTYNFDLPSLNGINNDINNKIQDLFFKENISSQNVNLKNQKETLLKKHKKPTGRLRKDEKKYGKHTKFTDDNVRKKIKHIVLKSIMKFLNMKIETLFHNNKSNNLLKNDLLLTLNKSPKFESSIDYNKQLLKRTIKEIFSEDISAKFTNYKLDFNKKLIEKLINEEDKGKREYFKALFNLTFLDCLKYFNKAKDIKELEGMDCIDDALEEFNNDNEYKEILYYNIKNFDIILNNKRSRNSKKKKEIKNENKNN